MKDFYKRIESLGHFRCEDYRKHVSKTTRKSTRGRNPYTAACTGDPHICRFIPNTPHERRCGQEPSLSCQARKHIVDINGRWRVNCGQCHQQFYID